jgi:hypothetical protein
MPGKPYIYTTRSTHFRTREIPLTCTQPYRRTLAPIILWRHRARVIAANQARYEALQLQLALREREEWRERRGDLLPASLDLLRHLRITYGAALAEQVAAALKPERDEGRKNPTEERTTLLEEIMLAGEQIDFPAIATEAFEVQPGGICLECVLWPHQH